MLTCILRKSSFLASSERFFIFSSLLSIIRIIIELLAIIRDSIYIFLITFIIDSIFRDKFNREIIKDFNIIDLELRSNLLINIKGTLL